MSGDRRNRKRRGGVQQQSGDLRHAVVVRVMLSIVIAGATVLSSVFLRRHPQEELSSTGEWRRDSPLAVSVRPTESERAARASPRWVWASPMG